MESTLKEEIKAYMDEAYKEFEPNDVTKFYEILENTDEGFLNLSNSDRDTLDSLLHASSSLRSRLSLTALH